MKHDPFRHVRVASGAVLHPNYRVAGEPYDTRVWGVSTDIVMDRFLAGESVMALAMDYSDPGDGDMARACDRIEDALRWEIRPRAWRARRVREHVRAVEREGKGGR